MNSIISVCTIVLLLVISQTCDAFYLPGVAPHSFSGGEAVELKVNKLRYCKYDESIFFRRINQTSRHFVQLSSVHTQLPFDYYSLKFCKPDGGVKPYSENLGEFLRGDRIENSAYEVLYM